MFTWFCPSTLETNEAVSKSTTVREPTAVGIGMKADATLDNGKFTGTISAHSGYPVGFSLVGVSDTSTVSMSPEGACVKSYDSDKLTLNFECADGSMGVSISAEGVISQY